MEIKKIDNYSEVNFETASFLFDPPKILKDKALIFSDSEKDINDDKIFSSPGEYNISEVYFWGFENKGKLVYLFEENGYTLLYFDKNLEENVKKQIKILRKEIDVFFSPNIENIDLVKDFKVSAVIVEKDINLPKFNKEKGEKIKFNPKKVESLLFILK